jgi:hypothetical protein
MTTSNLNQFFGIYLIWGLPCVFVLAGFATVDDACCGLGPYKALIPCLEGVSYCSDRRDHLFWDPYHPTEASNIFSANAFFSGGPEYIYPVNVEQLLAQ